jgi:sodium/proline symporter
MIIFSFLFFLCLFVAIGAASIFYKKETTSDYLVADRSINPWLMALSAVSSNNSGFMFIGLIGMTYMTGLSSIWIMVGWITGDYLAWHWVFKKLREKSGAFLANSIPEFVSHIGGKVSHPIRILTALTILAFLGTYAAAQLSAGSKALHVLFGWPYSTGACIGAAMVLIYCFSGGIRASIWTDAVQSIVMIVSMSVLCGVALTQIGGFGQLGLKLATIDPGLVHWIPQDLPMGFALYFLGWFMAGLGVVGQPHIMIRAFAINSANGIQKARKVYFTWYVAFIVSAILVGLCCRVILPDIGAFDAELALPTLANALLPDLFVGFILAGLFAATMSTADSQILSCSAALTQDIFPNRPNNYYLAKIGTVLVTAMVLGITLFGDQSVFNLVVLAWSMLAVTLGPLMIVQSLGKPLTTKQGIIMILAGAITTLAWRHFGLSSAIYEVAPGMAAGAVAYFIFRPFQNPKPH